MKGRLVAGLLVMAAVVCPQHLVDPKNTYDRVICVVPMVGKGTFDDPRRPLHAPLALSQLTLTEAGADCIKDIGGNGATSQSVRQRLMETQYYVGDLGVGANGPIMVAGTLSSKTVVLNGNAFFNPTQAPYINAAGNATTVNLLLQESNAAGLDYSRLSIADYQAATLLHELGHELGGLADDRNSNALSVTNSPKIWDDCLPRLKKQP